MHAVATTRAAATEAAIRRADSIRSRSTSDGSTARLYDAAIGTWAAAWSVGLLSGGASFRSAARDSRPAGLEIGAPAIRAPGQELSGTVKWCLLAPQFADTNRPVMAVHAAVICR